MAVRHYYFGVKSMFRFCRKDKNYAPHNSFESLARKLFRVSVYQFFRCAKAGLAPMRKDDVSPVTPPPPAHKALQAPRESLIPSGCK